jgi:peptidyl-prolyl cis-trans isomerase D
LSEAGRLSEPVIGNNGVYVFKVTKKEPGRREYNEANEVRRLNGSNQYTYGYQAMQVIVKSAEVTDNRIRFY